MLLAIDTSAGTSVAIVDPVAGVLATRDSADTRMHAEVIGAFIAEVLAEAKIEVTDLSGVAAGMGPGPFTGLRVGIAAARTFAFGAGVRLLPIVSHDAIAFSELNTECTRPLIVVTDARRREVYWSTYSGLDSRGIPVRVEGPGLCRPEILEEAVPDLGSYHRVDASTVAAASVGLLAETMSAHGIQFAGDDALYLRSPDVTISAGPKRVS